MGYTIAREDLATTTTVPDSLAFLGGQAWVHTTGTDMPGIALLKALAYQFQTKVQLPMYHGESGAGQDVTFYGTTEGSYLKWSAADDRLQTGGDADVRFVMTGSDLASGTETNKFEVDAGAKLVQMLSYLQVSTVCASTCTPGDMTVGFYKTGANSIGIKVDTTGTGNYQYGTWTNTSVAY